MGRERTQLPTNESERQAEEPPCDFVVHLAQRLGIGHEAARNRLSDWLCEYDFDAAPHPLRATARVARAR
jgi:hypothetical protein